MLTTTIPPAFTHFIEAGMRCRNARFAFERAPTSENEEAMHAAERALRRATENLPESAEEA
jgi:hypothetical protein